MIPTYTYAEVRERVLAVLDAAPDRICDEDGPCVYFTSPDDHVAPAPDAPPYCVIGFALQDVLRPVAGTVLPVTRRVANGESIETVARELFPHQFDHTALALLAFVQACNDDGLPWKDIAEGVRRIYPAPIRLASPRTGDNSPTEDLYVYA